MRKILKELDFFFELSDVGLLSKFISNKTACCKNASILKKYNPRIPHSVILAIHLTNLEIEGPFSLYVWIPLALECSCQRNKCSNNSKLQKVQVESFKVQVPYLMDLGWRYQDLSGPHQFILFLSLSRYVYFTVLNICMPLIVELVLLC